VADDFDADDHRIRALVHRYADAASRRNPAAVASTFADGGHWYSPPLGRFEGHDAMVSFFTSMLSGWNVFLQAMMSGVVVEDAPGRASGRWFVQETGQRAEGTDILIAGVYHDTYVREADGWLIEQRRYDALMRSTNGAVTTQPFPDDVPRIG
jgi:ketosteroid isomerase-like protein